MEKKQYAVFKGCEGDMRIDLTGQVFGRLTAVTPAGRNKHGQTMWACKCECGAEVVVVAGNMKSGNSCSCGCFRKELLTKHGDAPRPGNGGWTKEYRTWNNVRQRCLNPCSPRWLNYGGRGISICARWVNSYEAFLQDMGRGPEGTSIDRIDNNGNYEPGNCHWASATEQRKNQRPRRVPNTSVPEGSQHA